MNTIYNLIEELNNELRILANEKYDEYRKTILKDYSNYISIDLSKWNTLQKENLLINILEGIHYYYFIYSNKKSFPITSFNEVYNVINGQKTIYIYKKSIPYFSIKTIKLLLEEGYISNIEYRSFIKRSRSRNKPNTKNYVFNYENTKDYFNTPRLIAQFQEMFLNESGFIEFIYLICFDNKEYNSKNIRESYNYSYMDKYDFFNFYKNQGIIYSTPFYSGNKFIFNLNEYEFFNPVYSKNAIFAELFEFDQDIFMRNINFIGDKTDFRINLFANLYNQYDYKVLLNLYNEKIAETIIEDEPDEHIDYSNLLNNQGLNEMYDDDSDCMWNIDNLII